MCPLSLPAAAEWETGCGPVLHSICAHSLVSLRGGAVPPGALGRSPCLLWKLSLGQEGCKTQQRAWLFLSVSSPEREHREAVPQGLRHSPVGFLSLPCPPSETHPVPG